MAIMIEENTKWHTYKAYQFGIGLVSKRSKTTHPESIDGDSLFAHKIAEDNVDLSDEQKEEIQKDCEELVRLLKKFYYVDDFVDEK